MRSVAWTVTMMLSLTVVAGADPASISLYERLGGEKAIVAVVDDFVGNVAQDKRINAYFAKTDIAHL